MEEKIGESPSRYAYENEGGGRRGEGEERGGNVAIPLWLTREQRRGEEGVRVCFLGGGNGSEGSPILLAPTLSPSLAA